jgi:hypothetical protein
LLWAGHEGRRDRRWGNTRERDNVFNLGVDWRIIFKWIIKKQDGRAWTVGEGVMNLRIS